VTRPFIFVALCLAIASAALGQKIRPASAETSGLRAIAAPEGRQILDAIPTIDVESESETDCSHLVHDVYEQAGFPYHYASSRDLYIGSTSFTRVRAPQPGDLVVWRGHVGIVIDPAQHSFFSFVRSGPDTQFYDSPYWRSRGNPRFFRYRTAEPPHPAGLREAAERPDPQPLEEESRGPENYPIQTAGKDPSPEEVLAAFVAMNRISAQSLRTPSLAGSGKSTVVYRDLRLSPLQIKGKRGTARLRIESLGLPLDAQMASPPGWREELLEFKKAKTGWVLAPIPDVAYLKREVALKILSARLAELSKNSAATPAQEREQTHIIRVLNSLVLDDSSAPSPHSN
jgi:cell wall-associated NlpC family hydrolase